MSLFGGQHLHKRSLASFTIIPETSQSSEGITPELTFSWLRHSHPLRSLHPLLGEKHWCRRGHKAGGNSERIMQKQQGLAKVTKLVLRIHGIEVLRVGTL